MVAEAAANRLPLRAPRLGAPCRHGARRRANPLICFFPPQSASDILVFRRRDGRNFRAPRCESSGEKVAKLSVSHKESIRLPDYSDGYGRSFRISEFLNHPSGTESILNVRALQSVERIETDTFRCTLPAIQFLKFEVVPVVVLRVTTSSADCIVEMVSCEFGASQTADQQRFSAAMRNRITWDEDSAEPSLNFDVDLRIALQVYTLPFTMLPISAVETPGNLIMQGLIDNLFPRLVEQLLEDYRSWVETRCYRTAD